MLRLLIKDITVEKLAEPRQLSVHIRWHGGALTDLSVPLPPKAADRLRYPSAAVERVRKLAHNLLDAQIADQLNREGHVSSTGKPYTRSIIRWIRWRHQIPAPALQTPEELTVQQVAKYFGVSEGVVYHWIEKGMIKARRFNNGTPYWITLSAADEKKLRDWVQNSDRIHTGS